MTDDRQLYLRAVAEVLEFERPSVSFLQRRLRIGYNAAAALIEKMEAEKIVSAPDHIGRRAMLVDRHGRKHSELPDYCCPEGHRIPEQRFDAKVGCVVTSCRHRCDGAKARKGEMEAPSRYDEEAERKAFRELRALPAVVPVPVLADPPFEAWPAIFTLDEDGAVVPRELEFVPEPKPRDPDAVAAERLRQIVERLEDLIAQRSEIASIMADVRAFAKAIGFDPKAIGAVIKIRAMDPSARLEFEAIVTTYRHALGIEEPDFAIRLPPATMPLAPPARKLSLREKRVQEAILLTAASRAVEEV